MKATKRILCINLKTGKCLNGTPNDVGLFLQTGRTGIEDSDKAMTEIRKLMVGEYLFAGNMLSIGVKDHVSVEMRGTWLDKIGRTCPGHTADTDCEIDPANPCKACNAAEDAALARRDVTE